MSDFFVMQPLEVNGQFFKFSSSYDQSMDIFAAIVLRQTIDEAIKNQEYPKDKITDFNEEMTFINDLLIIGSPEIQQDMFYAIENYLETYPDEILSVYLHALSENFESIRNKFIDSFNKAENKIKNEKLKKKKIKMKKKSQRLNRK